jgi:hypothetical protein
MADKKRYKVEFEVTGSMIKEAFLQPKLPLNEANIRNSLEEIFEPKGDIGGNKVGDCKLNNVKVKEL